MEKKGNSIISYKSGFEILNLLQKPLYGARLLGNRLKKRRLFILPHSQNSRLELHFSEISSLIIGENCSLNVDLRDNPYIKTLIIKDGFSGSINLSRSSIRKIKIGTNCRCDLTMENGLNCFDFYAGDIFSGHIKIKDSCFCRLRIGYYCYADILLQNNWGRKFVSIGDSFRGRFQFFNSGIPHFSVGHDCRGQITMGEQDDFRRVGHLNIRDDFAGTLDMSNQGRVEKVEVGSFASGNFHFENCSGLKYIRFADAFNGMADLSGSEVEFVSAENGCRGQFVIKGCHRLILLQLPINKKSNISAETSPLRVEVNTRHLCYLFQERVVPSGYFVPFYRLWFWQIKRALRQI